MIRRFVGVALFLIGGIAIGASLAQAQPAAGAKVRGDAYYFYAADVYRGHAGDHAFLLGKYSSTGEPVPKEVIQEHASAMRANIASAKKSYDKASAAAKKDVKFKEIEKHQTAALASCDKLDAEGAKAVGDATKVGDACDGIEGALNRADEIHAKLATQLKIAPLEPPGS